MRSPNYFTLKFIGSFLFTLFIATPALGADTVAFRYGLFERQLPIDDLETYANNGEASRALNFILNYIDPQETWLQSFLNRSYQFNNNPNRNLIEIERLLTSTEGELVLERLGELVQPESQSQNGQTAIRSAIVLAASESPDFTLLDVLRQFPSETLVVNVAQIDELLLDITRLARLGIIPGGRSSSLPFSVDVDARTEADWLLQEGILLWFNASSSGFEGTVTKLERSLAIRRNLNDREGEAVTLLALSFLYNTFSGTYQEFELAIDYGQEALTIFQDLNLREGEGLSASNIGYALLQQEKYAEALDYYQRSLPTHLASETSSERRFTTAELITLGFPPLGEEFSPYRMVQGIHRYIGRGVALHQVGQIYRRLNLNEQALEYHRQSLEHHQATGFLGQQAAVLHGMGKTYLQMGEYDLALESLSQAEALYAQAGRKGIEDWQAEVESLSDDLEFLLTGEGWLAWDIAEVYFVQGRYNETIQFWKRHGTVEEFYHVLAAERYSDGYKASALFNLGVIYTTREDYEQAIAHYQQALAIYQTLGFAYEAGLTLARMGELHALQNQPEVAILFYKESVNTFEDIRQHNLALPTELHQAYVNKVADIYRQLADLLLDQGRILEAQQVLELLKVEELREYTRGRVLDVEARKVELSTLEQGIWDEFGGLIALGQRIETCEAEYIGDCNDLYVQRTALTSEFNDAVASFRAEIRQRLGEDPGALNPSEFVRVAGDILETPETVLVYPIVLKDKLWVLWATAGEVVNAVEVPVSQQQLGEAVLCFRQLLDHPDVETCDTRGRTEIQALAQELYRYLIPPQLEQEVAQREIKNLVFSLDRVTRYIPMAALHDGENYLIQRFTVSTVLSAGLTRRDNPLPTTVDDTSVLALGLSEAVPENPEEDIPGFNELPYVPAELNALTTIYGGQPLMNQEFGDRAFYQLRNHQILHIATHGVFVPAQQDRSYLILGDKRPLRIRQIEDIQQFFADLSLVVLSACESALGETSQDGIEINGMAHSFINAGANTVIASLWQVNDGSTSSLMQQFYQTLSQRTSENPITIAQALRESQLSFLNGDIDPAVWDELGRGPLGWGDRPGSSTSEADEAVPDLSHPYYWAPFIIIGNGL